MWGVLALAALLWPGHLEGPLDGLPLDRVTEAVLLGLIAPFLWWLQPSYLRHRLVRALIVFVVMTKAASFSLARDGFCVQFETPKPLVTDSVGRIKSWDARADWRDEAPQCSAILTRPYREFKEFPVWFFNMPPTDANLPGPGDRPPSAVLEMTVAGYLHAVHRGELIIESGESMSTAMVIDGKGVDAISPTRQQVMIEPGRHFIQVKSHLVSNRWAFVPLWNGVPIGSRGFVRTTTSVPATGDARMRGLLSWLIQIGVAALVVGWLVAFAVTWRDPVSLGFALAASVVVGWLGAHPADNYVMTPWASWSITALGLAAFLNVPKSHQTLKGAFVLIGIPWLTFITAVHASHVGRFSFYAGGDDMWMFQRFAYRIYLQGYWLQGGEPTFWFQPFYRWIAGALHMLFGDSSMGEFWWDAICLLVSGLLAFQVVAAANGFRWGLAAVVLCLTIVMQGPPWIFVGLGLSDIASAGFIYLAALILVSARLRGSVPLGTAIGAGLVATVGFYTRLNNLPMALASAAFAIPVLVPASALWRPATWWPQISWTTLLGVSGVIALGLVFFAWRTWYYTGIFSVAHGTTWHNHALWQAGQPVLTNLSAMASSVMMVLTFNDPPRFAWYAVPLLVGAIVALGAVLQMPLLREVPLPLAVFFLVACSGALAARGVAYAGRFSLHLLGAGCALTVCALAVTARRLALFRSSDPVRE